MLGGALFTVGMRWTDRLIGLVSTLILARLLVPTDFGIIAMASMVVGLIDVFLDLGVNLSLIQNQNASTDEFNTAWTLRLIQSALASSIIVVSAPLAAIYFHDGRVTDVLRVMALTILIAGVENIGVVSFQRNMEFGQDFRFSFLKRVISFGATVVAAFVLRSYWALVFGSILNRIASVALSYALHSYRPSLSLASMRSIWSFSQWALLRNIGAYFDNRLDKLLVGGRENSGVMGAYSLADEIAAIPSTELLTPLNRVLLPLFARQQNDLCSMKESYLLALAVQALMGIPACVGLNLVANEAVLILLGPKWLAAVPFIQIMVLINVAGAIGSSGGYVLLARGNIRTLSIYTWVQIFIFAIVTMLIMPRADALTIAIIRAAVVFMGLLIFARLILLELKNVHLWDLLNAIYRPILSSIAMYGILLMVSHSAILDFPIEAILAIKILIGAFVYISCLALLWWLVGQPFGAEAYLLRKAGLQE